MKSIEKWLPVSLAVIFTVLYSLLGLIRHWRFESYGYDLGIFTQAVWRYSRFLPPFSTVKVPNMIIFGDHFSPSLALLAPLFWVWADARILIIFQAAVVALGVLPVFWLARSLLKKTIFALAISLAYLLFFGFQSALIFDVHEIVLAAGLLPWLFYCLEKRKFGLYWLLFLVILGFKEDMSVLLFSIGIFMILWYRYWKEAIVTMILSFFWFLAVTRWVIPFFGGSFSHASVLPASFADLWTVLMTPFDKWRAVFWSFVSFAFLPLFGWETLPIMILHFFVHWLDPRFPGRWEMALHYRAVLGPVLAVGAVLGAKRIFSKNTKPLTLVSFGLLIIILVTQYVLHLPLNLLLKKEYWRREPRFVVAEKFIKRIPTAVSVATQNNYLPRLAARQNIYLLWHGSRPCPGTTNQECDWLLFDKADYILADFSPGQPINNFWGFDQKNLRAVMAQMIAEKKYSVVDNKGDIYLLKKT